MKKCKNEFVVKLIKVYQKNKQVIGVGHCKFYPTCSNYAIETYQKFNFFYASLLVGIRILRCNALAKRRYYPVKLTKKEKKEKAYLLSLKEKFNDDFIDYLESLDHLNLPSSDLYSYIYDYYYLPDHPHFETENNTIYTSRFIISDKELVRKKTFENKQPFLAYLNITKELFNQEIIKNSFNDVLNRPSNKFLIPIDQISVVDLLLHLEINSGVIVLNNYNQDINYLDFEIVRLEKNKVKIFKKLIQNKKNVIVLTNHLNILEYLEYLNYSINFYDSVSDINYFYHLNKRK